ncbi:MAG: ATP-binding protein [Anaerovoracaceae bacterium]
MRLNIKNIGIIQEASIEINGITVIAGENNTGKSTVGKALYSVFYSFYHLPDRMKSEKKVTILQILDRAESDILGVPWDRFDNASYEISELIMDHADSVSMGHLREYVLQAIGTDFRSLDQVQKAALDETAERIKKVLEIPDEELIQTILTRRIRSEFNGQINNIFTENAAEIGLAIQGKEAVIQIRDNTVEGVSDRFNLEKNILYLDDPQILDSVGRRYADAGYAHATDLQRKLRLGSQNGSAVQEILTSDKLKKIYEKLGEVCSGDFVKDEQRRFGYRLAGSEKIIQAENLSTGLKTFVTIKTLLQNGSLEERGVLILDEPEIHLHPQWQLVLAELIVLLQKEFSLHILLSTHSPYFLDAIEVYSEKYGISEKCKYYRTVMKNQQVVMEDLGHDTESIYAQLAQPLQDMENMRNEEHGSRQ